MDIKLDDATERALLAKANKRGQSVAELLKDLVTGRLLDPFVAIHGTPFSTVYARKDGSLQMRIDSADDPDLIA